MASNFCSHCGASVAGPDANVCTNCGKSLRTAQTEPTSNGNYYNTADDRKQSYNGGSGYGGASYNEAPRVQPVVAKSKSPVLALILSFLWVGLGQLYNGKLVKGLLIQLGVIIGSLLVLPGFIVWIYGLWDAYNDSEKMNRGEIPFASPTFLEIIGFIFFWFIIAGIVALLFTLILTPLMLFTAY